MTKLSASVLGIVVVAAAAALVAVGARKAEAGPRFTRETGKPCNFCHDRPPGLNAEGKKFKANGNKL